MRISVVLHVDMLINVFCLPLLCGDTAVCGVVCVTDSIKEVVECDCSVASRHVVSCRVVSCRVVSCHVC